MSSEDLENRERRKIEQVAREYRTRGYEVIVSPPSRALPPFLQGFRPDMLAKRADENVLVEVKTSKSLRGYHRLRELADRAKEFGNWRVELIVTNPRGHWWKEWDSDWLNAKEAEKRLALVRRLLRDGETEVALIALWTVLEPAVRRRLASEGKDADELTPMAAIKTLFSLGLVDRPTYDRLAESAELRNKAAHGYRIRKPGRFWIGDLLNIVDSLQMGD